MKRSFIAVLLLVLIPNFHLNAADETTSMEQLQRSNRELQEQIDALQQKISDHIDSISPGIPAEHDTSDYQTQITLRDSFNDLQEAAPRPYDITLNPKYRGFIPIPHTHAMIMFNAKPRVDMTNDSTYSGEPNMFVTADIPVSGQADKGGGHQFNMNAKGSQLSIDVRAPRINGDPRFYYENDFSGVGNAYLAFKVRHLYGVFYNVIVGQTYTVFEDADSWPDTVDYEGPNAAVSSRRPLVRYMLLFNDHWGMSFSIEKPDTQVDTDGDPTATSENHAPEGGFNLRWADKDIGHVQFGTIFRDIGVSGDVVGNQSVFGWGLNLSASLNTYKDDSFQTQLTYGQGIFYFMNDAVENGDAAFDSNDKLQPLPLVAATVGYTHYWSDRFRSTGSFGFINLDNQSAQAWDAYHRTYYASANLVFQLYKRLSFGLEGLYGYKQVKSGASGDVFRAQLSIMYALFR